MNVLFGEENAAWGVSVQVARHLKETAFKKAQKKATAPHPAFSLQKREEHPFMYALK
ncbi:hypothetical protein JCM9140_3370 [Halalkalibacter wakoensis JCM 9140]|uniref:Uncharacterized protein n=1 Tax=Halalkalibacter wakoensis JCM 9140 TaxID=1236970 RepID=W4Q5G1_9BACI|nr:hypothetical protein JCM9140_3370 [Halalkalibacter wakoensis JCM 9140]